MTPLSQALKWHNLGLTVLPCYGGSKSILKGYCKDSTLSVREYVNLFARGKLNLCLVTGQANNGLHLVILDFDCDSSWNGETYTAKTKRGKHCYFWTREKPGNLACEQAEIKCNSAKVMIPPSRVREWQYQVMDDREIREVDKIEDVIECVFLPSKEKNVTVNVTVNVIVCGDVFSFTRQSAIQTIKECVPISYLFPDYIVTGSGMTEGKAMAHCPSSAHKRGDLHPSLSLDLLTNRFNCFKPDCPFHLPRGGDVLDAYRIMYNVGLSQAIAELMEIVIE